LDEAESTKENYSISHGAPHRVCFNKAASMDVHVSDFESTGIYPLNRNRIPGYFFSISDTSETLTFMETTPPDMAPICAPSTSGTNSQNKLPTSAEPSLIYLNTTMLSSDTSPEEATPSRPFKISPVPIIPRTFSISEKQLFCSH
jgi:hypothetical protein